MAVLHKKHVALKRFRSLLGRLQHTAQIIPAAKGMFLPLNEATHSDPKKAGTGKASQVRAALLNLKHVVLSLTSRPTHVSELIEHKPELAGTRDASAAGAGAAWLRCDIQQTAWQLEWPPEVIALHRKGTLMSSDLEMAGVLLQRLAAERLRPFWQCHTAIWSDNTPATSWSTKMADTATAPIAGQLLRALAMRQRTHGVALPSVTHCAGAQNLLADTATRSFAKFHMDLPANSPPCLTANFQRPSIACFLSLPFHR